MARHTSGGDPPETLKRQAEKRNLDVTSEPEGKQAPRRKNLSYVVQKHWTSRLHYDFRLEWSGIQLSWAVPLLSRCSKWPAT
jgi:bifunctional non-homologous end joining protein LigD